MATRILAITILIFCVLTSASFATSGSEKITSLLNGEIKNLLKTYKYLHANPELSLHEKNTAKKLAKELKKLDFDVTTNFGGYGLVGVLKNGNGPTILIRTKMDALPLRERTNLEYASNATMRDRTGQNMPVMHATAHDMHMTIWIGTAQILSQLKQDWNGTLIMIAQPAEAIGEGARMMIQNRLFELFPKPDYALSMHLIPELASGKIGYKSGFMMANVDTVDIHINGIGGHAAEPEKAIDPIILSSKLILDLKTIPSQSLAPNDSAVISVGAINGGNRHNIIPDKVKLKLTIRSYKDKVRSQIFKAIRRIADSNASAAGLKKNKYPKIAFKKNYTPSLYNDPLLLEKLIPIYRQAVGFGNVVEVDPFMIGEDFSRYGRTKENIPLNMFVLGIGDSSKINGEKPNSTLNSSLLKVHSPELVIKSGVKAMSMSVINLMKKIQ